MKKLHVSAAPHINSGVSTSSIMRDVTIAMLPTAIAAIVLLVYLHYGSFLYA